MTDKEKELLTKIAEFPDAVKDKFLSMAEGAAIALEAKEGDRERKDS